MNKNVGKILFTVTLLFFNYISAQGTFGPITVSLGEEIIEDKEKIVNIAGETGGKVYTLATKGKNYFVKVFESNSFKLLATNKIELPDFKGKEIEFEELAVLQDRIYILGSVFDKKAKENKLYAIEVDKQGMLTSNKKELFSTSVEKKRAAGAFYTKYNPGEDKLLLLHVAHFSKDKTIQYEVKLMDSEANVITSHLERIPYTDRKDLEFTIADYDISTKDDFFIVVNESYRDKKAKKNIEKFQVHMFKENRGYEKEIVKINLENKEIINGSLFANSDNQLHILGFFSDVRKNGKANKNLRGVYNVAIDIDGSSIIDANFNDFDYETKVKLIGERRAKKDKDVKPRYATHSIIEKEDGSLIMLSEYQLITATKGGGIGPLSVTALVFQNNEIIVTSFNSNGTVKWTSVVPKEQKAAFTTVGFTLSFSGSSGNVTVGGGLTFPIGVLGKGPEYLSAIPIYENGELMIIFNDNPKNDGVTDINEVKGMGNYNKSLPSVFIYDDNGNVERIDQKTSSKEQLIIRPAVFYRVAPSEYIIYASKKSKDKMGRLNVSRL